MNPFLYQNVCWGEYFCSRQNDIHYLNNLITNGSNVLIYSKRRLGKSSLIKEYFTNHIDKEKYLTIYLDLFDVTNFSDFIKKFYLQIVYALPYEQKTILKKLRELFIRANYSATVNYDGDLDFTLSLLSYNFEESMSDIYKGLSQLSLDLNKEIVIAFDEFQNIKLIKDVAIDAELKKYMQKYDTVKYIFTGLKRHNLKDIFSKRKSPLFETVTFMELMPIPIKDFYYFVDQKFNSRLPFRLFEYIYTVTEGESKLIQEYCYHLYYKDSLKITQEDIDDVCQFLLDSKSSYFRMLIDRLTLPQKTALKAIVLSDGKELYTKSNLFKLQTSKSSLNTAIKYLYNEEIIDKDDNAYYINNKCLELWCKKEFV